MNADSKHEHSLDRAIEEFCFLPTDIENPIRWGFIGAWEADNPNCVVSVLTTSEDDFFNPSASDENVAVFAAVFTNPNTIKVCKYLFRNKEHSRENIKTGCNLSDEELDVAVKPLLEWFFVEWKDGKLESVGHGINNVITLVLMARVAFDEKTCYEKCTIK